MAQLPFPDLSPKQFDSQNMGGIAGWIKTILITLGFVVIMQGLTIYKDWLKGKRDNTVSMAIERISISMELISQQYSTNSSEKQVSLVSNLAYKNLKSELVIFAVDVIKRNNIDQNWPEISKKVDEYVKVRYDDIILNSFMNFRNTSGKYLAYYLRQEKMINELKCSIKELIRARAEPDVIQDTIERKISVMRMDYYKQIKNDLV